MTFKPMPKAVLIDMDGTLADSLPLLYNIFVKFLNELGIEATSEEFMRFNGATFTDIIADLKAKYGWQESHDRLLEKYQVLLRSDYKNLAKPFPGVVEFLTYVRQKGLKAVLVTSAEDELASSFLEANDLDQYFDFVVSANHATRSKPDPEVFFIALEFLALEPQEALAIEDSSRGIQSAKNAGIEVLAFGQEYKTWKELLNHFAETYG